MIKTIAGHPVDVNEEGYLTDMTLWNEEIAAAIAADEQCAAAAGARTDHLGRSANRISARPELRQALEKVIEMLQRRRR